MTLLALALAYSGLTALCLAMDKHQRQTLGHTLDASATFALRAAGALLLAAALLACLTELSGALGVMVWLGVLTGAGIALVFLLPYAPRVAAAIAGGAPLIAGAAALLTLR